MQKRLCHQLEQGKTKAAEELDAATLELVRGPITARMVANLEAHVGEFQMAFWRAEAEVSGLTFGDYVRVGVAVGMIKPEQLEASQ